MVTGRRLCSQCAPKTCSRGLNGLIRRTSKQVEGGCRVGCLEDRELKLLQCHSLAMEHGGIAHDFGLLTRRFGVSGACGYPSEFLGVSPLG